MPSRPRAGDRRRCVWRALSNAPLKNSTQGLAAAAQTVHSDRHIHQTAKYRQELLFLAGQPGVSLHFRLCRSLPFNAGPRQHTQRNALQPLSFKLTPCLRA